MADDAALAWHVIMRLKRDRVLAPTVARRRIAARLIYKQGDARELLAFGVADTHIHAVIAAPRAAAGRFANYVESALRWGLDLPVSFDAARFIPVFDQAHLKNATRYSVRQQARHTPGDDPLAEGSSLFDWLGMRVLGGDTRTRLKSLLPRVTSNELLGWLDGAVDATAWGKGAQVRQDVWPLLGGIAASAAGLATLRSQSDIAAAARRAALHVGKTALPPDVMRDILELTSRTYQRLLNRPVDGALCNAIDAQLRVRSNLKTRAEVAARAEAAASHSEVAAPPSR